MPVRPISMGLRQPPHISRWVKRTTHAPPTPQSSRTTDNLVGARRQLVALLVDAGEFESARNLLAAGIAANPHNYQLYQDYALIDLKSTGVDSALATADRLQSQDRDLCPDRRLEGDIYMAANRPARCR